MKRQWAWCIATKTRRKLKWLLGSVFCELIPLLWLTFLNEALRQSRNKVNMQVQQLETLTQIWKLFKGLDFNFVLYWLLWAVDKEQLCSVGWKQRLLQTVAGRTVFVFLRYFVRLRKAAPCRRRSSIWLRTPKWQGYSQQPVGTQKLRMKKFHGTFGL
jgi:hypothetical protein